MSALGQKRTYAAHKADVRFTPNSDRESGHVPMVMSALPLKADMCSARDDVRYVPKADIHSRSVAPTLPIRFAKFWQD